MFKYEAQLVLPVGVSGLVLQENTEQNPQTVTTGVPFSPQSEVVHCVMMKSKRKR